MAISHTSDQPANQLTPTVADLWFLPLGGTGEIGMNLNLYAHDQSWLMVDCGVTFDKERTGISSILMPDPAFISERRDSLAGLVLTHAHEDHVGAVAYLWPYLRCPVYATAFTAYVLRRKLIERGLAGQVPIIEVTDGQSLDIGPFHVQWMSITHSIPEAHSLLIQTDAGNVFHTGDWKLDTGPVIGQPIQPDKFQNLAGLPINAMVCDSTNAMEPGTSRSESELLSGLCEVSAQVKGAVVVTTFASNLARLHTLAETAIATDRKLCLLGRSLLNMIAAAQATGHWHSEVDFVQPYDLSRQPKKKLLIVATGSQGDPQAALFRLAKCKHRHFRMAAGDAVIFSSRIIPGNEAAVEEVVDALQKAGVLIITDGDVKVHASGHPAQDELLQMYSWVKPEIAIPVHGTEAHMEAHAKIVKSTGQMLAMTGLNGDLFRIAPEPTIDRQFAQTGQLGLCPEGRVVSR